MKKWVVALVIVLVVAVLGISVGGYYLFNDYQTNEKIIEAVNTNQNVSKKVLSDYKVILDNLDSSLNDDSSTNENSSSKDYVTSLQKANNDFDSLLAYTQNEGKNKLQKGPNSDTENLYNLYVEFLSSTENSTKKLKVFSQSMVCFFTEADKIEASLNSTQPLFEAIEKSEDPELIANNSRELSKIFNATSLQMDEQKKCLSSIDDDKQLSSTSSSLDPTTIEAFRDLSTSFNGLAEAVEENDNEKAEFFSSSIATLTNSPDSAYLQYNKQYEAVFDAFTKSLDTSLQSISDSVDKLNTEFDKIAEKYNLQVVKE